MKITVTGEAKASFPPEEATLQLSLGFESDDMSDAVERTTALANTLSEAIASLKEATPPSLTTAALLPLATSSWRPYNNEGTLLPMRHRATARARLTFSHFGTMSLFVDTWSRQPGVTLDDVEWRLTDDRLARERAAILTAAVADAHDKAQVLAAAAAESRVMFLELTEPSALDGHEPRMFARSAAMMDAAPAGSIELSPADIEITAQIRAVFTTD